MNTMFTETACSALPVRASVQVSSQIEYLPPDVLPRGRITDSWERRIRFGETCCCVVQEDIALSRCNTSKARLSHVGYRDCSIDSSKAMDHVAILHISEGFELQRGQNVSSYSSKRTTEYIDKRQESSGQWRAPRKAESLIHHNRPDLNGGQRSWKVC